MRRFARVVGPMEHDKFIESHACQYVASVASIYLSSTLLDMLKKSKNCFCFFSFYLIVVVNSSLIVVSKSYLSLLYSVNNCITSYIRTENICTVFECVLQSWRPLFPAVEFELRREIRRLQEYRKAGIKSFCSESALTFSHSSDQHNFIRHFYGNCALHSLAAIMALF